jgi:aminoglycoside 3-N-acetyltransferase
MSFPLYIGGADTVIEALLDVCGPEGTLCIPSLSYLFTTESNPTFHIRSTPTNLGVIPETFRRREGVLRSLHPTHSVCAYGAQAEEITRDHAKDRSPVGVHSPFRKIRDLGGQVVFLGCSPRCNTSIHGVEETLSDPPPYLFKQSTITYTITGDDGEQVRVEHKRHNFEKTGQRYERLVAMLEGSSHYSAGPVMQGFIHVFDAEAMWATAGDALRRDALSLVEPAPLGEDHFLVTHSNGMHGYVVRPSSL